jgi:hypothetical protein
MGKAEREKKRATTIPAYAAMLTAALETVPEARKTGELVFHIKFSDGGFYGHSLRITEDVKFNGAE